MFGVEVHQQVLAGSNDERRRALLEGGGVELLVAVAERPRAVDDHRALIDRPFQQVRRVDVAHVEGRVLAHHHDVHVGKRQPQRRAHAVVVVAFNGIEVRNGFVRENQIPHPADDAPVLQRQVANAEHGNPPAATLRGADHGQRGILLDVERLDGVRDERDVAARRH